MRLVLIVCLTLALGTVGNADRYTPGREPVHNGILPPPLRQPLKAYLANLTQAKSVDVNCGTLTALDPPLTKKMALACLESEKGKTRSFLFMVSSAGQTKLEVVNGVVGRRDGQKFWFTYDSAPCGDPRNCSEEFSYGACSNMVIENHEISCDQSSPPAPKKKTKGG
jgi:hypothetical protein